MTTTKNNVHKINPHQEIVEIHNTVVMKIHSQARFEKIEELKQRIEVLKDSDFEDGSIDMYPITKGSLDHIFLRARVNPHVRMNLQSRRVLKQANWGYQGDDPHTVAVSVLAHFNNEDMKFAWKYFYLFTEEILTDLNNKTHYKIPCDLILEWIGYTKKAEAQRASATLLKEAS